MRPAMMFIGVILTGGTALSVYLGMKLKVTKERAKKASAELKADAENNRARRKLRSDWANEHEVISDHSFKSFPHESQVIGGVTVHCPKCKEL
jgi:hypothetical protein